MSRKFDSLAMALRAFELARIWTGPEFMPGGPMELRRIRTERAADYLYRRVRRAL